MQCFVNVQRKCFAWTSIAFQMIFSDADCKRWLIVCLHYQDSQLQEFFLVNFIVRNIDHIQEKSSFLIFDKTMYVTFWRWHGSLNIFFSNWLVTVGCLFENFWHTIQNLDIRKYRNMFVFPSERQCQSFFCEFNHIFYFFLNNFK